jgi:amicyanin
MIKIKNVVVICALQAAISLPASALAQPYQSYGMYPSMPPAYGYPRPPAQMMYQHPQGYGAHRQHRQMFRQYHPMHKSHPMYQPRSGHSGTYSSGANSYSGSPAAAPKQHKMTSPSSDSAKATDAMQTAKIEISNMQFTPARVVVKSGSQVTWVQQDAAPHVVMSSNSDELRSATLRSGESYTHTFSEPGTYEYYCSLHPSMKGTIVVE